LALLAVIILPALADDSEVDGKKKKPPKKTQKPNKAPAKKPQAPKKSSKKAPKKGKGAKPKKNGKKAPPKKRKANVCPPPGYKSGKCIDNTKKCCPKGTVFVDGDFCPGKSDNARIVCCAKKTKGKPDKPKPKPKKKKNPKGWSRDDCAKVANSWLKKKVMYSQTPLVKQYISHGKGKYRPDCSGFVSATWNVPPPGSVTWTIKYKTVSSSKNMKRCDAVLCQSCIGSINHLALFWGWAKDGRPLMIEEFNFGHPIVKRAWDYSYFNKFKKIRRPGWK